VAQKKEPLIGKKRANTFYESSGSKRQRFSDESGDADDEEGEEEGEFEQSEGDDDDLSPVKEVSE
jgi:hypothetical protein